MDRLGRLRAALGRPRDGRVRRPRVPRPGGSQGGDSRRPAAVARPLRAGVALARQAGGRGLGGRGDRSERRRRARGGRLPRPRGAGRTALLAAARGTAPARGHRAHASARRRSQRRRARSSSGSRRSLRHGHVLPPGSFVFVLSDYLAPIRPAEWVRLRALRWDVVPVIVQDPTWEQSFPDVRGVVVPFADPGDGRGRADAVHTPRSARSRPRARAAARPGPEDVPSPRLRPGRRRQRGRVRPARGLGGSPASAPAAGRVKLACRRAGGARPRRACGRGRPRGALRGRVPARDDRPWAVRPARRRAPRLSLRRVRGPDRLSRRRHGPRPPARDARAGQGHEAALTGPRLRCPPRTSAGPAAGLLIAAGGAARPPRGGARRRRAAAGGVARRRSTGSAVRFASSASRPPARRATAGARSTISRRRSATSPPAERATRLAWARPEPEPDATLGDRGRGRAVTTIPFGELEAIAPATRRTLALRVAPRPGRRGRGGRSSSCSAAASAAPPALLPAGSDGLVVLDLSASISSDTYARIGGTLDRLADSGGRYGLIVFSDTAYLALPPGTPAAELRPFARQIRSAGARRSARSWCRRTPGRGSFSAGTKISTGLQLALDTIQRETPRAAGRAARQRSRRRHRRPRAPDRHRALAAAARRPGPRRRAQPGREGRALHQAPAPPARRPLAGGPAGQERETRGGQVRLALLLAALAAAVRLALRELLLTRLERA